MKPHILHIEIYQRMFTELYWTWILLVFIVKARCAPKKSYLLEKESGLKEVVILKFLKFSLWRHLERSCVGPEHSTQQVNLVQKEDFPFPARQVKGSGTELNWIELVYLCVGKGMTLETPLNFCVNNDLVFAIAMQLSFSHIKD